MEPDFIATELLRELKRENERKDTQIKRLNITLCAIVLAVAVSLMTCVGTLTWCVNQIDFSHICATVENDSVTP